MLKIPKTVVHKILRLACKFLYPNKDKGTCDYDKHKGSPGYDYNRCCEKECPILIESGIYEEEN